MSWFQQHRANCPLAHLVGSPAITIVLLFPFTRLVHMLVAPLPYLWRKPEVVRWYGIRKIPTALERRAREREAVRG